MTEKTQTHSFPSTLLKAALGTLVVLNLSGCNGLARFVAKPEAKPADAEVVKKEPLPPLPPAKDKPEPKIPASPLYEWNANGREVTRIVVNTTNQKARFYSGDDEIGWSTVATGISNYPTPTGKFEVIEKVENKRSNLYGKVYGKGGKVIRSSAKVGRDPIPDGARFEGSKMPYFLRLTHDGVGLHAGPIPRPGKPASHGCIRMPAKLAPVVFSHVSNGAQVTIEGKGPTYADYLVKQRAIATREANAQRRASERKAAQTRRAVAASSKPTAPAGAQTATDAQSQAVAKDVTAVTPTSTAQAPVEAQAPATAPAPQLAQQTPSATPTPAVPQAVSPAPATPTNPVTAPSPAATATAVKPDTAATAAAPAPTTAAPAAPTAPKPPAAPTAPAPAPAAAPAATPAPQPTAAAPSAPATPAAPKPAPAAPAPAQTPAAATPPAAETKPAAQ